LTNNQWISGRGHNTIRDIGLKVYNAGAGKVEVVPPSGDNRVRLDSFVTMPLKKGEKSLPHLTKTKTPARWRVIYESERRTTLRSSLSTGCLIGILGPEIHLADWAQLSNVSAFIKEGNVILAFWKSLQVMSSRCAGETMWLQKLKFRINIRLSRTMN
jgi:hypothetical protein